MALVGGSLAAAAVGTAAIARWRRVRRARPHVGGAGSMFVGAVEEVELSGPLGATSELEAFDPEDVPSEHQEINELRRKMPMG